MAIEIHEAVFDVMKQGGKLEIEKLQFGKIYYVRLVSRGGLDVTCAKNMDLQVALEELAENVLFEGKE